MVDLSYLKDLISLLKAQGVPSFKMGTLEILLPLEGGESKDAVQALPAESQMPVDLRSDNVTDYDKILHWSGSPEQEVALPLTGEEPL